MMIKISQFLSRQFVQEKIKHTEKGSLLIFVLWILIVLTALAASVGFRSRIQIQLSSMNDRDTVGLYENFSAVNLASYFIEQDEDPQNDSKLESWYGTPANYSQYDISKKILLSISDEEGKLNLNKVTPEILQNFLEILDDNNIKLDTDADDLTGSIMAWRGTQSIQGKSTLGYEHKRAKFESVDELRLIQYITPNDYETLKPYFTVYGSGADFFLKVNINTANEWIIEAIIKSQPGGDLEKKDLLNKLNAIRKRNENTSSGELPFAFQAADLSPQVFMERLGLINSPPMIQLANFTLRFLTVDSQYFHIELTQQRDKWSLPKKVEVVVGSALPILIKQPRGSGYGIQNMMNNVLRGYPYEILYWRESAIG